jgi:hypothetical protein
MSDAVQEIRKRGTRGTLVTVCDVLGLITITPEERDALFAHIDKLEAKHYQLRVAAGRFLGQTSARNAQALAKALEEK